jgi:predicted nucleic acid-binding protein
MVIILDSSFLIGFHNSTDNHHAAAANLMERILGGRYGTPVLLEYVFLEVVTVVSVRVDHKTALAAADSLLRARELRFVPCSEFFSSTLEVFAQPESSRLSFVDCAILASARRNPPGWVATFDSQLATRQGVQAPPLL